MIDASRQFDPEVPGLSPALRAALHDAAALDPRHAAERLAAAARRLHPLFGTTETVVVHAGSAGALREMGLRSAVEQRALAIVAGEDGARLADQVEALGREVLRLHVRPGRAVEPAHLDRFLGGPGVDTVTTVHVEGSTGVALPLAELAHVVRARRDLLLVVDASHSLGAAPVELDRWGLDFVVAPSEGPLGMPHGLAFAAASPRLLTRARTLSGRGSQLDFVAHHQAAVEGRTLAPVPAPLVAALEHQLRQILEVETLPARWSRHTTLGAMVQEWAAGRGDVTLAAVEGRRATALSVLELGGRAAGAHAALVEQGWQVGEGPRVGTLRIAHQGECRPEELRGLLAALGGVLDRVTAP